MVSNSKLFPHQKYWLKQFTYDSGVTFGEFDGITVAMIRAGCVNRFAVSIASIGEKKFRNNVGQYHACARLDSGQSTICPIYTDPQNIAESLGSLF